LREDLDLAIQHNEEATKRWCTREKRATSMLWRLEKERRKLLKRRDAAPPVPALPPSPLPKIAPELPVPPPLMYRPPIIEKAREEDIPTFLERMPNNKDEEARAEILAQQDADKKHKAERRLEKMKVGQEVKDAELTGKRRKMPLTGRAALDALK